jgi:mannose-6-phosphate isomerase-like protein (cupin superfamily)
MLRLEHFRWGTVDWLASGSLGNSVELSVARMYIEPGMGTAWHQHPHCEEAVVVLKGAIRCVIDDRLFELQTSGSLVIPSGCAHNISNVGSERATLLVSYSTARRVYQQARHGGADKACSNLCRIPATERTTQEL